MNGSEVGIIVDRWIGVLRSLVCVTGGHQKLRRSRRSVDWCSPISSVRNRRSPELRRSRQSVDWCSPISSVRNRRSPELCHSRRMRMLGDRVVYTPPQGARRRVSQRT